MNELEEGEYRSPPGAPGLVKYHRQMLAIACLVFVLAFALHERPDGRVALRGLSRFPVPQTCASQIWFGIKCPGCGLTRSIIHLAEGDWRASWQDHRLGAVMAVLIALQIPYRVMALRRPGHDVIAPHLHAVFAYTLIALLVGNWLVNLACSRISSP
jgi:Protein of unknown function (DUF2752)